MSNAGHHLGILLDARDLIAQEGAYCATDLARDISGKPIDPSDPEAVSWCAMGAVYRSGGDEDIINFLHEVSGSNADTVNDAGGRAEVLEMFDRAIRVAGAADAEEEGELMDEAERGLARALAVADWG